MSVKSNQIPNISYELDILKVASALGIDQDQLLSYVYSKIDQEKQCDDKDISPKFRGIRVR